MKRLKTSLCASLSLFGIAAMAATVSAAPSSIFSPIIGSIRRSLPSGMVMRLPTDTVVFAPHLSHNRYASLGSRQPGRLRINLDSQPNCQARACMNGYFETGRRDLGALRRIDRSSPSYLGEAPITLADGIVGTYYSFHLRGASAGAFAVIMWEQDNQNYIVSAAWQRQDLIDFARSMATEPPITRYP